MNKSQLSLEAVDAAKAISNEISNSQENEAMQISGNIFNPCASPYFPNYITHQDSLFNGECADLPNAWGCVSKLLNPCAMRFYPRIKAFNSYAHCSVLNPHADVFYMPYVPNNSTLNPNAKPFVPQHSILILNEDGVDVDDISPKGLIIDIL